MRAEALDEEEEDWASAALLIHSRGGNRIKVAVPAALSRVEIFDALTTPHALLDLIISPEAPIDLSNAMRLASSRFSIARASSTSSIGSPRRPARPRPTSTSALGVIEPEDGDLALDPRICDAKAAAAIASWLRTAN